MNLHKGDERKVAPADLPAGHLSAGSSDEPVQHRIKVRLFLGTDPIAAHLAVRDGLEIHRVDQLVDRQLVGEVGFVSQYQQRDSVQRGLGHQIVQFLRRDR